MDNEKRPRRRNEGGPNGDSHDEGGDNRRPRRRMGAYCPSGKCFDYKDPEALRRHVNEAGKIKPRRQTGCCARCQRELAREVKRARHLALLPFVLSGD
jgi:small subunit ribosomal protein S18